MQLETQYIINSNPKLKSFLRENSYWYKYLNRSPTYIKPFIKEMKDKYKLTPKDKFNKITEDINTFKTFLSILSSK
jgi:hypothetical protein